METEECLKSLVTQAMDGSEPWMEAKLWMEASRRLLLSCRVARIVYVLQTYMVQADAEMWQRYVIKHMFSYRTISQESNWRQRSDEAATVKS